MDLLMEEKILYDIECDRMAQYDEETLTDEEYYDKYNAKKPRRDIYYG